MSGNEKFPKIENLRFENLVLIMARFLGVKIRYFLKDSLKEMRVGGPKVVPKRYPKVDPKPDPLWGAQVLRNTRNSKGFGAFWPLRGIHFRTHLGTILDSISAALSGMKPGCVKGGGGGPLPRPPPPGGGRRWSSTNLQDHRRTPLPQLHIC